MKKTILPLIFSLLSLLSLIVFSLEAEELVLLFTNDTHSNIDTDSQGVGGVLPRKALIDSVRRKEKNVVLIDAGDKVQGTLYFNYFKGDVEYPVFNMMDYDIRILGNHEFDNGLDELARHWRDVKADRLSANYDFSDTPAKGLFKPYVIKKIAGKKVGFIGINVDPESLISEKNYKGMVYSDPIEAANRYAAELKRKGCDLVVAVTHIGYDEGAKPDDLKLARQSRDIDIIIGGHSHTFVDPATPGETPYWIQNADGKPVLVTQTGKYGKNIGYIKLDLDNFKGGKMTYKYIPVTDRFHRDSYDWRIERFLKDYRQKVDSVNSRVIGVSEMDMPNLRGACAYANWAGDFASYYGRHITDSLRAAGHEVAPFAFAMMNVGGIRQPMRKGPVTEGQILATFPFSNRLRIIEIDGADLLATMAIVGPKGGEAVSGEVRVVTDSLGNPLRMLLNGEEVQPGKKYVMATIDYIAEGNDDMTPMKRHREIWRDDEMVSTRILEYVYKLTRDGLPVTTDPNLRFVKAIQ